VQALEFLLQNWVRCRQAVHDPFGPFEILPLPLIRPIGWRAGKNRAKIRDFIRQFDHLRPDGLLGCIDDLEPFTFCLRQRFVVSHFQDQRRHIRTEAAYQFFIGNAGILNRVVKQGGDHKICVRFCQSTRNQCEVSVSVRDAD